MIKIKLTPDQVYCLCLFTSPAYFEKRVKLSIENHTYNELASQFNLVSIGEKAAKIYLLAPKNKYKISLSYSEAASLFVHVVGLCNQDNIPGYSAHVAEIIKNDLHQQLTNYKIKLYARLENNPTHGDQRITEAPQGITSGRGYETGTN